MLVTGGGHRLRPTVGRHLNSEPLWANCPDTGHAIASRSCLPINRIAVVWRSGEQKLIVFAAGERESNRRDADGPGIGSTGPRDRYPIKFHLCADSTFFAQMPKISGEAVGQIDGGGGESPLVEPPSFGDPRGRVGMAADKKSLMGAREFNLPLSRGLRGSAGRQEFETCQGVSESTRDIDVISRFGTVPKKRPTSARRTDQGNAEKESGLGRRGVSTDERYVIKAASLHQTGVQLIDVWPLHCPRDRERNEQIARNGAHRGNVAEVGHGGSVADRLRRYRFQIKVDTFGKQVRGEMPPGFGGGLDHGCIVADALNEPWRVTGIPIFEGSDQGKFLNGRIGLTTGHGTIL